MIFELYYKYHMNFNIKGIFHMLNFILKIFGLIPDYKPRYSIEYHKRSGKWIIVEITGVKRRKVGNEYNTRSQALNGLFLYKK